MKRSPRFFIFRCCAWLAVFDYSAIAAESYADGNSVAAQSDGKIVVAGYADVGGVDQFALVRYNSDGSLDTSFNINGKVTTAVGTGTCKGQGVAVQGDGKIVVMGHEFVSPVRWADTNRLILERHDYYEKLMPSSGSTHGFGRLYEITVSFKEDGTANTSWNLRDDR
jgi:uncharacterized delta-60 repeat protein